MPEFRDVTPIYTADEEALYQPDEGIQAETDDPDQLYAVNMAKRYVKADTPSHIGVSCVASS